MARPVTTLVVFFLCFNLWAGLLTATGAAGAIGLDTAVGGDGERESLQDSVNEVPSGSGAGDTLFGLYNVLTRFIDTMFGFLMPGLDLLNNAGVPQDYTDTLQNLFVVLISIDIVAFFRGYNL